MNEEVHTKDIIYNSASYFLKIADFSIKMSFENIDVNNINLLASLNAFIISSSKIDDDRLFDLKITESLPNSSYSYIGTFDTGNGDTIVNRSDDEGYKFTIKDTNKNTCCELLANKNFSKCFCKLNGNINMRRFGLNNALMMTFAFAASFKETLLIHASAIRENEFGYAFIAKSGTGKSTHTGLWLKYIKGCDLLNDDNPIIRIINGIPYMYGSPWSGKTPCYRNIKTRLHAITRIDRAEKNYIEQLKPTEAFASLLPSCSTMKWDKIIYSAICNNIIHIIEKINIYTLHCLPDKNAAILCHKQIRK